MQTGGCGRKTTSSFRYFDVVLVKWKTSPCQVSVLAGHGVFYRRYSIVQFKHHQLCILCI